MFLRLPIFLWKIGVTACLLEGSLEHSVLDFSVVFPNPTSSYLSSESALIHFPTGQVRREIGLKIEVVCAFTGFDSPKLVNL